MFGNKKTESALNVVNQVVKSGNYAQQDGAIVFTRKVGRKTVNTGVVYLRKNKIYAAEVENLPFAMGTRIMSAGALKASDFETMERQFAGQLNHSGILAYLLQKQQITELLAQTFYNEYLLSCIEEMFSWDSVVGGWKPGEVYQLPVLSKENTLYLYSLQDLQKALNDRRVLFREFFNLTSRFFKAGQLHDLVFLAKRPLEGSVSREGVRLHEMARTGVSLNRASKELGMTTNEVFRSMMWFWKADFVDVVLDNASVSYATAQKASKLGVGREDELANLISPAVQAPADDAFTVVPTMLLQADQEVLPFEDPQLADAENSELDEDAERVMIERLGEIEDEESREHTGSVFDDEEDDDGDPEEETEGFFDTPQDEEVAREEEEDDSEQEDSSAEEHEDDEESEEPAEVQSEDTAEIQPDILPEESPVFRIKQRLDELADQKEDADLRLEDARNRKREQVESVERIKNELRALTGQLGEAQRLLTTASAEEAQLQEVCDDLELQIAETISTFQYPGR